ncbi:MAG TPA: hypothetical protein VJ840_08975 [Gemmatimonadaceae bacterium]|nr:hypothetical protein [Gemmatimonadaceae bacterium]
MRRFSFAFLMLVLIAGAASAQRRGRVFTSDPDYWVSGGVAGFTGNRVNDGRSASTWEFGDAWNWQYSASLEKTFANGGTSFGVAATYARVPFSYLGPAVAVNGVPGTTCTRCDAHLDMTTVAATLHIGAGTGLHGVYEFTGGIINYANLKRESDGAVLAGGSNTDPMFSFGWGVGYGFDDRTQIEFVPTLAIGIHERTGLANGVGNTNRINSFRLTLRKGFGNRSLRR